MSRALMLLGSISVLVLSLVAARPAAPVIGPGAVIEMQTRFLAALDAGDEKAVADFVAEGDQPTSLLLVDLGGRNVQADGLPTARAKLADLAKERREQGGTFTSKLVKSQADCSAERLSYGVFEFETTHKVGERITSRRFAATTLAYWSKAGMKVLRMHISELGEQPDALARQQR